MIRRQFWLKKDKAPKKDAATKKKARDHTSKKVKIDPTEAYLKNQSRQVLDMSPSEVLQKLKDIVADRMRSRQNLEENFEFLKEFLANLQDNVQRLEVIMHLIPYRYELASASSAFMSREFWLQYLDNLQEIVDFMRVEDKKLSQIRTFYSEGDEYYKSTLIKNNVCSYIETLYDECKKAFLDLDFNSEEYINRLIDQQSLLKLSVEVQEFYELVEKNAEKAARLSFLRLESLYNLKQSAINKMMEESEANSKPIDENFLTNDVKSVIVDLAKEIYKNGEQKNQILALLYHSFHLSLNGEFNEAKDLLLMSKIPEQIQFVDPILQVHYNRLLVQLGLGAFKEGKMNECYDFLSEMVSSGRIRELLGQGFSKNPVNEKDEARRQMPFHIHINVDLVEATFLVCCIILETPIIASANMNANQCQNINKYFKRMIEAYDRYVFPLVLILVLYFPFRKFKRHYFLCLHSNV